MTEQEREAFERVCLQRDQFAAALQWTRAFLDRVADAFPDHLRSADSHVRIEGSQWVEAHALIHRVIGLLHGMKPTDMGREKRLLYDQALRDVERCAAILSNVSEEHQEPDEDER